MEHAQKIDGIRQRIKKFVLAVIYLIHKLPKEEVSRVLIGQVIRSSTSIGANYEEASEAQTNKDVIYKLSIVKKEAKETKYWLELINELYPNFEQNVKILMIENMELIRIFSSIIAKRKNY